jgi:ssDNA-binding Zn-finger/Zn-ribbon topoisomerase 1
MLKRRNKATGGLFYGCSRWPFCKETAEIPEREKMLAAGAAELPGFETEGN